MIKRDIKQTIDQTWHILGLIKQPLDIKKPNKKSQKSTKTNSEGKIMKKMHILRRVALLHNCAVPSLIVLVPLTI